MILEAPGTLAAGANIQYLRTLLHGKALLQLDTFSFEVGSNTTEHLSLIILVLVTYFPLVNVLSKKKRVMHRVMRKTHGLKSNTLR